MKNHKWLDNTCVRCGLKREKREHKKAGVPYSRLNYHGIWVDVVPYTYSMDWYYGNEHKFNRPDCKWPF